MVSRKEHLNGDYDDIAYNYLVCRHGYIYIGRGYQYQSAANRDGNSTYYAICGLTGILDGPVLLPGTTPPLVSAISRVIAHLETLGAIASDIVGHGDIPGNDTLCPGNLRPYVEDGSFQPESTTAETVPEPDAHIRVAQAAEPPEWPGVEFTNPPPTEHVSVQVWQEQMVTRGWRLDVDGVYEGPVTVRQDTRPAHPERQVCITWMREHDTRAEASTHRPPHTEAPGSGHP